MDKKQGVFEELKKRITIQPVLVLPKRKEKFRVKVDALEHTIGGVLLQEQEGKQRPIAFLSKIILPTEKNYEIYNKKLLAIVKALDKW